MAPPIVSAAALQAAPAFVGFFAHDPIDEMRAVLLYLVLPTAVGILLARLLLYVRAKRGASRPLFSSASAASVLIGTLLSAAFYFVFLVAFLVIVRGTVTAGVVIVDLILAAMLVGPIVLIFGFLSLVYLACQANNVRPLVLNLTVYAGSALGFLLAYVWLRSSGGS
jgi:hypothetical protein